MKLVRREFGVDYENYQFGYSLWAFLEPDDALAEVYNQGFLPYSGQPPSPLTLYMARSVRIVLNDWKPNSENRRILRKADWDFTRESVTTANFDLQDESFLRFCNGYFLDRHQKDIQDSGKLSAVLESGFVSEVVTYRTVEGQVLGYVLLAGDQCMSHYWFSFYDSSLASQSLGMWLMIQEARQAQEQGKDFLYLGTCYGPSSVYKTNFDGIEWWSGSDWSTDKKRLKSLARAEA